MPIHHVYYLVPASKVEAEVNFLVAAFGHMGLKEIMRPIPAVVGLGEDDAPWLWVGGIDENQQPIPDDVKVLRTHVALVAKDRAQVDAFHAAALKAGATCYGPPGLRPEYSPDYYAAFVISPGGHNFEAVVRRPDAGIGSAGDS